MAIKNRVLPLWFLHRGVAIAVVQSGVRHRGFMKGVAPSWFHHLGCAIRVLPSGSLPRVSQSQFRHLGVAILVSPLCFRNK